MIFWRSRNCTQCTSLRPPTLTRFVSSKPVSVARLFGIFSLLALALSAVGLYSVVSYGVATRTLGRVLSGDGPGFGRDSRSVRIFLRRCKMMCVVSSPYCG